MKNTGLNNIYGDEPLPQAALVARSCRGTAHRGSRGCYKFIIGLIMLWPVSGWAHALSPAYYPLGPLPVYLGVEWWPLFLLIPLSIAVETFVLGVWIRNLGILSNLWRAAALYVTARAGEAAVLYLNIFRYAGWSSSVAKNVGPLVLFLIAGLLIAVPVALLLYRGTDARTKTVVMAAGTASLAGYLSAFGYSLMLIMARGY